MNRKLKKLIKTPRSYFVDMFKKKVANGALSVKFLPMLKVQGKHKFSVVSAVYGVEKYLEKYFISLENQTLNFTDHIELIMVDDGSLDGSANIIKKWVVKYPDNIKYVKKENGGQASARNLGMKYVSNDWVTFIDPDDFIDMSYFAEVDKFISKQKNVALVYCNFVFYLEDKDLFADTHHLRHRYINDEMVLDTDKLKNNIQLNVNAAFFKTGIIKMHHLVMEPNIKTTFEDAHFVGKYLLSLTGQSVGFIKSAKYFYRKRADNSSVIDTSWMTLDQYTTKLKYGYLDLLKQAKVVENNKYSVVSAVYGVEKYLEQFFRSLENQTLSFVDHIELIMVDDGSLDNSAEIIKKWADKYPENIRYISKENGGQASARNMGMEYAKNEWVTFVDPDDFIDINYFAEVDNFLSMETSLSMVSCNLIFYLEDSDSLSDNHPLNYKFKNKKAVFSIKDMQGNIQLSASTSFFRKSLIDKSQLKMDPNIKPTFEDGHFIGLYLLSINDDSYVGFVKAAKYYYRKRENNSSTIDKSWNSVDHYTTKLKYGYLNLLKYAKRTKHEIPKYIHQMVLYDLIWYLKYIVNHSELISFLGDQKKDGFLAFINQIFCYIDNDVIGRFNFAGCWFYHKVGILGAFKGESPSFQIVYLEEVDPLKSLIKLRYFYYGSLPLEQLTLDQEEVTPVYVKTRMHDFVDEVFVNERIIWLPSSKESKTLRVNIGDLKTRLSFAGKNHYNGVSTESIIRHFARKELDDKDFPEPVRILRRLAKSPVTSRPYHNAWLFMDRDSQADDNAEHLYRYIIKNHPDINAHFVLRKTSHDWNRLEEEGFRLIDFSSIEHKLALLNADHLISSHADHYVVSLLEDKWFSDIPKYRYTFLQHGITQNDISNWLNSKPIDLFITATQSEFSSIVNDQSRYKYSEREVSLTGFPRHDALLQLNNSIKAEKLIVIMPTWREGIVGKTVGQGNEREISEEFYSSHYARAWKSLLHSDQLEQQVASDGYEVVFFPHVNIRPYLDWFEAPEHIKTISHFDVVSMQHLFCRAAIMITDYSSVAFEMAYLNKAVIYYQFDYDYVYGGGHIVSKGYFDYERDGFGPVCLTEADVLTAMVTILCNKAIPAEVYLDRIENMFTQRDGLCCQRVYEGIARIGKPEVFKSQKMKMALKYAQKATEDEVWSLASKRWEHIYKDTELSPDILRDAGLSLVRSCRLDGRLGEANRWMEDLNIKSDTIFDDKKEFNLELARLFVSSYTWEKAIRSWHKARSFMFSKDWKKALEYWKLVNPNVEGQIHIDSVFYTIECLAYLKKWQDIEEEIFTLKDHKLSETENILLKGWEHAARSEWTKALDIWKSNPEPVMSSHFYIALSVSSMEVCNFSDVLLYMNMVKLDPPGAFPSYPIVNRVPKLKNNEETFLFDASDMSAGEMHKLVRSLYHYNYMSEANAFLKRALYVYPKDKGLRAEKSKLLN